MSTLPRFSWLAALVFVTGASSAFAAPLPKQQAEELSYVAQTLELARLCKVPEAQYTELVKYAQRAKDVHGPSSGVPAAEVDKALQAGRDKAKAQAAGLTPEKCSATFRDVGRANEAFRNLNKTLDSLAQFADPLLAAPTGKK